jgi:pimeloyl-ACP methyl ester carboxylesterase
MTMTTTEKSKKKVEIWPGYYRCDDLYPPLCDDELTITRGRVETLTGIFISYWRYTPNKLISTKFPIVVINGGPGLPHNYVEPSRSLAGDGREVVMYDQASTGESQLTPIDEGKTVYEVYPELFTIEYYAEIELPNLLLELGWMDYHVLGTSWGTQVAFQFAVPTAPTNDSIARNSNNEGLKSLILAAPIADNHKFVEYQWNPEYGSLVTLPTYIQERLNHFNRTRDFDSEEFEVLENIVNSNFNARLGIAVETEAAGISTLDLDRMMGRTDMFYPKFNVTLKNRTVLPQLHKFGDILPIQLNYGKYDMVRPPLIADTANAIGGSMVEYHLYRRAAHAMMLDEPHGIYQNIMDFLIRVEDTTTSFHSNRACPSVISRPTTSSNMVGHAAMDYHLFLMVLFFLGSLLLAFKLGMWAGTKQNAERKGYEMVGEA